VNKYLEKIAMASPKHYGKAMLDVVKESPLAVALGAGGALEGALSTTPIKTRKGENESAARYYLRGAKNTLVGAAKGAAAGKGAELGYQFLKGEANRKAMADIVKKAGAWDKVPGATKLSLGLGAASLGVGTANLVSSQLRYHRQNQSNNLQAKSLDVLKGIHKEVAKKE
jgi:hypothetical protein